MSYLIEDVAMSMLRILLALVMVFFNVCSQDHIALREEDQIKESYESWREGQEDTWRKWGKETLLSKMFSLIPGLEEKLQFLQEVVQKSPEEQRKLQVLYGTNFVIETQIDALYEYNLLRELLHLPPVQSFSDMSSMWVNQVSREAEPYMQLEKTGYDLPQFGQIQLFEQARKLLNLNQDILLFSHYDYYKRGISTADKHSIAICRTPDVDEQLAILYHEIGHILMSKRDYEKGVSTVDRYLEIGKKAFDTSTALGKHINQIISEHTTFWIPPSDPQEHDRIVFERNQEKLADLFEIENLFKQNQINAILLEIAQYATMDAPVASSVDTYPSPFERAVYITGFLVDHGVNINKAFKEWYARGVCRPMPEESLDVLFSQPAKSQGARDFIRGYTLWLDEQLAHEVKLLVENIDFFLARQKERPSPTNETELLKLYNYLRRRLNKTRVTSLRDIDRSWLKEQKEKFSDKRPLVISDTTII